MRGLRGKSTTQRYDNTMSPPTPQGKSSHQRILFHSLQSPTRGWLRMVRMPEVRLKRRFWTKNVVVRGFAGRMAGSVGRTAAWGGTCGGRNFPPSTDFSCPREDSDRRLTSGQGFADASIGIFLLPAPLAIFGCSWLRHGNRCSRPSRVRRTGPIGPIGPIGPVGPIRQRNRKKRKAKIKIAESACGGLLPHFCILLFDLCFDPGG